MIDVQLVMSILVYACEVFLGIALYKEYQARKTT